MDGGLPTLRETKRTLDGSEKRFDCRLLSSPADRASVVVLFVSPKAMQVHGVILPAGTVTFGHFWARRPYNVYHWLDRAGETLGYYFNLCDEVSLAADTVTWRDLVVDVLVRPGHTPQVLDEDELDLFAVSAPVRARVAEALARLRGDLPALLPALDSARRALWTLHDAAIAAEIRRVGLS